MHEHKAEVPNSGQEFSERMAGEQAEGGEDTMRKHGAEVPRVGKAEVPPLARAECNLCRL